MSHLAVDQFTNVIQADFAGPVEADRALETPAADIDRTEVIVRGISRFAGYGSLAAAIAGLAYIANR